MLGSFGLIKKGKRPGIDSLLVSFPPPGNPVPFSQTNWPNPTLRKQAGWMEFGQTLLLTTLALVAQRGALVTKGPVRAVQQPSDPPNLLVSTLGGVQAPFDQVNWSNPVLRVRTVQPDPIPNLSVIGFAPNPIPEFNQDFPNPVLRVRTVQPEVPLNLSTLGFAPNPIPEFNNDFPNPVLRVRTVQPEPPPNITGKILPPFRETDWPNPLIRRVMQVDPIPDLLTGTLNQAVNQTPFQHPEQPNPVLRIPPDRSQIPPDLLTGTLNQAANQTPFQHPEQPNPVLKLRTVQPELIPNLSNTTLGTATPFDQTDWPNPVLRVRAVYRDTSSTFPPLYPNPIPFDQADWPNPTLRTRTVQPEIPTDLLPLQTFVPSNNLPRRPLSTRPPPRRVFQTDIPPNIAIAIYYFNSSPPFNQKVWPVHRQRFDWLSQTFDTLRYDDDHIPFSQDAWPNPEPKRFFANNQVFINQNVFNSPQVTMRKPATVPIIRTRTIQPEIPINIRPLTGPQQPPFTTQNDDFQNPVRKLRTVQPEIPINYAISHTAAIPPFFLRNQPNPTLSVSRYGYWVFQFDRLNLSLQPAGWSNINDDQTPAWGATGDACTADTTVITADDTTGTADTDCSATFSPIDDSDTPSWTPVGVVLPIGHICTIDTTLETLDTTLYTLDAECQEWNTIDDSDTPGWSTVLTDPAGTSSS